MSSFFSALSRRKTDDVQEEESKLARVLNLVDLTALGVGSTLGLGVYVLAGSVAYNIAGPAVTLSFIVAAIASAFAAICYAEFAARVPKAGSAYIYSYVTIGEFVAFTIGWNLLLEYIIGTAGVAAGVSKYFDAMIGGSMSRYLSETLPINVSFLGTYPDFLGFGIILVLTALLTFGVKESSILNNAFTLINLLTILTVIIAGAIKCDYNNWFIPKERVPEGFGVGGFMPFGVAGVMAGAAKCFFGFVGFDCIATTGEEAINPKRNIPLAVILSLIIIFLSYFGISTVITMMVPYYEQNPDSPLTSAFEAIGWIALKWIINVGAVFALCTSLLGVMFPMPRILYAMGTDGLLFKRFANVSAYTQTPVFSTITSGIFAGLMALIFELNQLIEMMSIGTLLAYTIVAICVLILRYRDEDMQTRKVNINVSTVLGQLYNGNKYREPNKLTSAITQVGIVLFFVVCIIWCLISTLYGFESTNAIISLSIIGAVLIVIIIVIALQPISNIELSFKVPLVPLLPCISVFINVYLMFQLDANTWIRFIVWLIIGYVIYFGYSIRHSTQIARNKNISNAALNMQHVNAGYEHDIKVDIHVNNNINNYNHNNIKDMKI